MRAWQIGGRTGIDGLRRVERPDPVPSPGDALVAVRAAGLNYRDLMVLAGLYGRDLPETRVPLGDGVGVVIAGDAALVGKRVIAPHFTGWIDGPYSPAVFAADLGVSRDGWLADRIVLPTDSLVEVPDGVRDATAATLAAVGATVWHALVTFGGLQPGELVLTQGTGGVALFTLQLAKALGADVAITSSSAYKLDRCRAMGADFAIDYRARPDWAAALLEATGGRGADLVVDTIGFGALGETIAACATNARIATVGALSGTPQAQAGASQGAIIGKNLTIKGVASGSRAMLAAALDVVAQHGIEMVVDRSFAFDEASAALRHLESGAHMGKVLVEVG
ncbi:Phthiocerol synthesis polyketide synthase type I PpsC [Tsuneonella dongtanensis]|uniref:Phthiocerol synthesis polyketide synthase type I PpsC n=1 Tax=Tsuneonella dongtanensis TaxID=692370 RepID=A0A1B2AG35_9SPHN|nr:NAD(P)-dependent alcohol dehydrogenase [Tsuneonella dongtanensis]ANY21112.1 Phthiocerol synthesis polyketide synthase type I PpsC [Tsuneonella dongtanensis]